MSGYISLENLLAQREKRLEELRAAIRPLVDEYLANEGTNHEFVVMIGHNEDLLQMWRKVREVVGERLDQDK